LLACRGPFAALFAPNYMLLGSWKRYNVRKPGENEIISCDNRQTINAPIIPGITYFKAHLRGAYPVTPQKYENNE